jgi:HTH-type transcriptional regulator, transcriptional repressor of NAD biosynthesis genes
MTTTGLVLGKFLPPHAGHLALVDFASRMVDELTVVVGTLSREPIDGALRHRWMRELAPQANVVHLADENPQDPSEHPEFWDIWRTSLQRVAPHRIDRVFASEPYGARLAHELGATFVPFDLPRALVPISGTAVRRDPFAAWAHLPPCVRAHYCKRVCIFGPESTGKSTLTRMLAEQFDTTFAPEYARTWLEAKAGDVQPADMPIIARGQVALEDAMARQCRHVLFCDTDPLTTTIWSDALFGAIDPEVRALAEARRYDLTLLCDVDVPWVPDVVRYLPAERASFLARCERALSKAGRRTVVLRGGWEDRFTSAVRAVESMMRHAFHPAG